MPRGQARLHKTTMEKCFETETEEDWEQPQEEAHTENISNRKITHTSNLWISSTFSLPQFPYFSVSMSGSCSFLASGIKPPLSLVLWCFARIQPSEPEPETRAETLNVSGLAACEENTELKGHNRENWELWCAFVWESDKSWQRWDCCYVPAKKLQQCPDGHFSYISSRPLLINRKGKSWHRSGIPPTTDLVKDGLVTQRSEIGWDKPS